MTKSSRAQWMVIFLLVTIFDDVERGSSCVCWRWCCLYLVHVLSKDRRKHNPQPTISGTDLTSACVADLQLL